MTKGENLRWFIDGQEVAESKEPVSIGEWNANNDNTVFSGKTHTINIFNKDWTYYMRRKNKFYFKRGQSKIWAEIEEGSEAYKGMLTLKYGTELEIDYEIEN